LSWTVVEISSGNNEILNANIIDAYSKKFLNHIAEMSTMNVGLEHSNPAIKCIDCTTYFITHASL
jgi:hypothetical protein